MQNAELNKERRNSETCHCEVSAPTNAVNLKKQENFAATEKVCHCEPVRTLVWQSVSLETKDFRKPE